MCRAIQEFLQHPVTKKEAESIHTGKDERVFGHIAEEWRKLVAVLESETSAQLWFFRSPPETWTTFPRRGLEGYAVVKEGSVIDFILTAIS
jgi:hypothetical protein